MILILVTRAENLFQNLCVLWLQDIKENRPLFCLFVHLFCFLVNKHSLKLLSKTLQLKQLNDAILSIHPRNLTLLEIVVKAKAYIFDCREVFPKKMSPAPYT